MDGRGRYIDTFPAWWGVMLTPSIWKANTRDTTFGRKWAADNEAFKGKFEWGAFSDWLVEMRPLSPDCLFAVAPDVVGDSCATLDLFRRYGWRIRALGYPVAYVAQDGCENLPLPPADALFIGGSDDFKESRAVDTVITRARVAGMWVHAGRVNTQRRIRHFQRVGVDSVDGTCLTFGWRANYPRLNAALQQRPLMRLEA